MIASTLSRLGMERGSGSRFFAPAAPGVGIIELRVVAFLRHVVFAVLKLLVSRFLSVLELLVRRLLSVLKTFFLRFLTVLQGLFLIGVCSHGDSPILPRLE
jgi:hypothetical protein